MFHKWFIFLLHCVNTAASLSPAPLTHFTHSLLYTITYSPFLLCIHVYFLSTFILISFIGRTQSEQVAALVHLPTWFPRSFPCSVHHLSTLNYTPVQHFSPLFSSFIGQIQPGQVDASLASPLHFHWIAFPFFVSTRLFCFVMHLCLSLLSDIQPGPVAACSLGPLPLLILSPFASTTSLDVTQQLFNRLRPRSNRLLTSDSPAHHKHDSRRCIYSPGFCTGDSRLIADATWVTPSPFLLWVREWLMDVRAR